MTGKEISSKVSVLVAIGWMLVSFVALAAMFHLWFTRERVMYIGHDVRGKQVSLFRYVGFPEGLLAGVDGARSALPLGARYSTSGDDNLLSYPRYLLVPRVYDGGSSTRLIIGADHVEKVPDASIVNPGSPRASMMAISGQLADRKAGAPGAVEDIPANPFGFLLSVAVVSCLAFLVMRLFPSGSMISFPGAFSVAIVVQVALVIFSRVAFGRLDPACFLLITASAVGFLLYLKAHCSRLCLLTALRNGFSGLDSGRMKIVSLVCLFLISGFFLWSFLKTVIAVPDAWDCWANWGMKSKMLALGTGKIDDVIRLFPTDYPLAWPSLWAFSGWFSGGWEDQWSKGWGAILMLLCAVEMAVIVNRQSKSLSWGIIAGAVFMSVPAVPLIASWGYAEPLLWLMVVCAFGMLHSWLSTGSRSSLLAAGIIAAGAGLTKNEGLVFAFSLGLWILLQKREKRISSILIFSAAVALVYLPWFLLLRVFIGISYESLPPVLSSAGELSGKISRLGPAFRKILDIWVDIRQWNIVLVGVAIFVPLFLFKGSRSARVNLMVPLLVLLVSLGTMVLRVGDIDWQVGTAWNRITAQALPLLIVAIVLEYISWKQADSAG